MTITLEDAGECISALENSSSYTFVLETDGNLRPFVNEDDYVENILVILTPEWYELTYCANGWTENDLKHELNAFQMAMKKLDDEFISTKFTVVWR
jgi:hypothetical protein